MLKHDIKCYLLHTRKTSSKKKRKLIINIVLRKQKTFSTKSMSNNILILT